MSPFIPLSLSSLLCLLVLASLCMTDTCNEAVMAVGRPEATQLVQFPSRQKERSLSVCLSGENKNIPIDCGKHQWVEPNNCGFLQHLLLILQLHPSGVTTKPPSLTSLLAIRAMQLFNHPEDFSPILRRNMNWIVMENQQRFRFYSTHRLCNAQYSSIGFGWCEVENVFPPSGMHQRLPCIISKLPVLLLHTHTHTQSSSSMT